MIKSGRTTVRYHLCTMGFFACMIPSHIQRGARMSRAVWQKCETAQSSSDLQENTEVPCVFIMPAFHSSASSKEGFPLVPTCQDLQLFQIRPARATVQTLQTSWSIFLLRAVQNIKREAVVVNQAS